MKGLHDMPISDNFTPAEAEDIIAGAMKRLRLKRVDVEKLLNHDRRSKRNPLLENQWIDHLDKICNALREGRAAPAGLWASVFWIRLHGALVDLRKRYRKMAEFHQYLVERGKENSFAAASAAVFDACEALRNSLTDHELVYATFARHVEAHVYQDSFEYEVERGNPKINQPGAVRTKQMIPAIQRHIGVDEAHEIVDAIQKKANYDDGRIAVNFAHKVGPHVERLAQAMKALDVEREKDQVASTARRPAIAKRWAERR